MPTTTPFANLITFSRGTNATVVGPDGLVQWAPSNLLLNSEQFDNANWTKAGAIIYPNQDVAGGTLGSELVTNGDFSNGSTGWITTSWVVSGGVATITNVIDSIAQNVSFTAGRLYRVTYTVTAFSGTGGVRPRFFGGTTVTGTTVSAPGTYTEYLYAVTGNTQVAIASTSNTCTVSIDNISVREVTPAAAVAPDGTYTADTLVDDGTSSRHGVNQNPTIAASATYTTSLYVKAGTGRYFTLSVSRAAAGSVYYAARYDLQTATVTATGVGGGGGTHTASSITAVGNGWYRCVLTGVLSTFTDAVVVASGAINPTGFGDRGTEIYVGSGLTWLIWGAQLEVGSAATTYNSTTVKNLLGFSEAFDNAAWTKIGSSIVTGAQANPVNGLFNAQKLMENTANSDHYAYQDCTVISGTPYVFSVYAKKSGNDFVRLSITQEAVGAWFNLNTGAVGTVTGTGITARITDVGGGWYRCSITKTATGTGWRVNTYTSKVDNSIVYTGDGNSGIYIYGAQLSDSASLDPYVPTPGAAPSSTAYYGPRFDYDPATLQPRGILIEEQRTNLLVRSEEFDNASWTKNNATVTANATISPDGTVNADKLVEDTSSNAHNIRQNATVSSATSYTFSVYAKAAERSQIQIQYFDGTTNRFPVFSLIDGTKVTDNGIGSSWTSTSVGNGWWRFTITVTSAGTTAQCYVYTASGGTVSYTGDGTSGIYVWGAQLEIGAFATSYIPTIASTATRNADSLFLSGQNFAQWYRQDAGAWYAEFNVLDQAGVTYTVSDGTGNNRFIGYPASSVQLEITTGGVLQASLDGGTITPNTNVKVASAYATNDAALSLNGGTAVSDASVTPPAVNQSRIGANVGGGNLLNGHIRSIRYIPVRAADFQLQALTT